MYNNTTLPSYDIWGFIMECTEISCHNMLFLFGHVHTPQEMVSFLRSGARFRGFDDVLHRVYPGCDLVDRLSKGLAEFNHEPLERVTRKVRNWVKGQNIPQNRKTLFQICFVLELTETQTSYVLAVASETGIHYRNPSELIYSFALRTGRTYPQAVALKEHLLPVSLPAQTLNRPPALTRQIRDAFAGISTEEELFVFLRQHSSDLGQLHETAYQCFMNLLQRLQQPESIGGQQERRYSVEELVQEYLRMNVPQTKKVAGYGLLQRMVKNTGPMNEASPICATVRKM